MLTCLPPTSPIRTTEPTLAQEPVTVAEARRQCRIGDGIDYHDEELSGLIPAARRQVEKDAILVFYTGSFTWTITAFSSGQFLEIDGVRPVTAISSIAYIDTAGDSQTWASSNYSLKEFHRKHSAVALTYGNSWPSVRGDVNGITITLTAGYSSVLAMPPEAKVAVKLALHVQWLLNMGMFAEAESQQTAYERQIELLRPEVYA